MSRPLRVQYPGAFYHVACRGNERKSIFVSNEDRVQFLELLKASLKTYHVVLYAYMLMNNHFHLLVQTTKANLSEFMRHFNICYTGWFNYRHNRCGHLYQGRYKAFLIDADSYLLEVSRYLHLNILRMPTSRGVGYRRHWQSLVEYRWSSLHGYLEENLTKNFVDYDFILGLVGGRRYYRNFITDGLKRGLRNPFKDVKQGLILGDDDFVLRVKSEYLVDGSVREQPSYRGLVMTEIEPETLLNCVAHVLGVDKQLFSVRLGDGVARGIASDLLYRYSGLSQPEIGELLGGIDYSGVSHLRRRLKRKMAKDKKVIAQYKKAEDEVKKKVSSVKI